MRRAVLFSLLAASVLVGCGSGEEEPVVGDNPAAANGVTVPPDQARPGGPPRNTLPAGEGRTGGGPGGEGITTR
jgi:hypothetical protein